MSTYAARTSIAPEKTRNEIHALLKAHGAMHFGYLETPEGDTIAFEMRGRRYRFTLPLPPAKDYSRTPGSKSRTTSQVLAAHNQAIRARWRSLYLIVKAKLVAVTDGVSCFETEFLPWALVRTEQGVGTVQQWLEPQLASAYVEGNVPALMDGVGLKALGVPTR